MSEEIKHYGVPGMKWGKTKGSYNAMTSDQKRGVRETFKEKTNARIDAARGRVKSGQVKQQYKQDKYQYKLAKASATTEKGKGIAKDIFQKKKDKYTSEVNTARAIKYGKEQYLALAAAGLTLHPVVAVTTAVSIGVNGESQRQKIGTGSGLKK